jgi:hypothetical protein
MKENLIRWRIIETLFFYYMFCHWCACIMITTAINNDEWTGTWLRRCPVPQVHGTRQLPDDHSDMSKLSIYVHALYYVAGTVSHVAIGDITAVNVNEFWINTFFGWIATFVYCLLFADITTLVASASSKQFKSFLKRKAYILS